MIRLVRIARTPRLRNGDFSENLSTGDVVRVVETDDDGDLVVERLGWNDYLSVAPEYVEDVDAYPMACGRCWGVHPVGACDA